MRADRPPCQRGARPCVLCPLEGKQIADVPVVAAAQGTVRRLCEPRASGPACSPDPDPGRPSSRAAPASAAVLTRGRRSPGEVRSCFREPSPQPSGRLRRGGRFSSVSWRCAPPMFPGRPRASLSLWTRPRGTRVLKSWGRLCRFSECLWGQSPRSRWGRRCRKASPSAFLLSFRLSLKAIRSYSVRG